MTFQDREDAGKQLAERLLQFKDNKDCVVVGLPRGGVVTGHEVSKKLNVPLDVLVPRKIGAPGNPEFAIGAIDEEGNGVFDERIIKSEQISQEYIDQEVEKEKKEAKRRLEIFRKGLPALTFEDKTIIIVDDGIATGSTMKAAIRSAKTKNAKRVVVAVPVLPNNAVKEFEEEADEFIYLHAPRFFGAVGMFYQTFEQTTDEEASALLQKNRELIKQS